MTVDRPLLTRRKMIIGALAAGAATTANLGRPNSPLDYLGTDTLEDIIPEQIGRWSYATISGLVIPPEDELSKALYSQLLTRVYTDGESPPIMLLIAYSSGQTGILQIHRPEVCYPVGGFELSPITTDSLRVGQTDIPANWLSATAESVTEHIVYWTRVGNEMPTSWWDQRVAVAAANLRGIIPDAVLVRISTRRVDEANARKALEEFSASLIPSIEPRRRSVLIAG